MGHVCPRRVVVKHTVGVVFSTISLAAIVLVVALTAVVVVTVLGLFIWGAIQDGREENAFKASRRRKTPPR